MKKIYKAIILLCMTLCYIFIFSITSIAATSSCNLTIGLVDEDKHLIEGLNVFVCKIADMKDDSYVLTDDFNDSGLSISGIISDSSEANAIDIYKYIKENNIASVSEVSKEGKAVFSSLDQGIWLVYCADDQEYRFNPYFVFLPQIVDGVSNYDVTSKPKIEENSLNNKSIYVIKKWDDNNNSANKRPESISVDLLLNEEVIDTVELSESNGWSHTFKSLVNEGSYTVKERSVENYSAKYSGDSENGFIIINTY